MVTKIVFEVFAGLVIVTFGSTWWALFKRDRLLRKRAKKGSGLEKTVLERMEGSHRKINNWSRR